MLFDVDISFNPVGAEGAEALVKVLYEDNESLESLGDIQGYFWILIWFLIYCLIKHKYWNGCCKYLTSQESFKN